MRWHWQNLEEDSSGNKTGSGLMNGRAWFRAGDDEGDGLPCLSVEWCLLRKSSTTGLTLDVNPYDDHHVGLSARVRNVFALHLGLEVPYRGKLRGLLQRLVAGGDMGNGEYNGRTLSIDIIEGSIHWRLWVDDSGWTNNRPRWRDGSVNLVDLALGKEEVIPLSTYVTHEVLVPMVERAYKGKCTIQHYARKRPRWFARFSTTATIDMAKGEQIPIPGKGENSYDCGDDATYAMSVPATTVHEAVSRLVASVLRTRSQRGGLSWRNGPPTPPMPPQAPQSPLTETFYKGISSEALMGRMRPAPLGGYGGLIDRLLTAHRAAEDAKTPRRNAITG